MLKLPKGKKKKKIRKFTGIAQKFQILQKIEPKNLDGQTFKRQ